MMSDVRCGYNIAHIILFQKVQCCVLCISVHEIYASEKVTSHTESFARSNYSFDRGYRYSELRVIFIFASVIYINPKWCIIHVDGDSQLESTVMCRKKIVYDTNENSDGDGYDAECAETPNKKKKVTWSYRRSRSSRDCRNSTRRVAQGHCLFRGWMMRLKTNSLSETLLKIYTD